MEDKIIELKERANIRLKSELFYKKKEFKKWRGSKLVDNPILKEYRKKKMEKLEKEIEVLQFLLKKINEVK